MSARSKGETRALLALALPVAGTYLANNAMQIVDTFFVGQLGAEPLGGVAIAGSAFNLIFIVGVGLLLGLDFSMSHAIGAGRRDEANRLFVQALYLATIISLPFIALLWLAPAAFAAFGISDGVLAEAIPYLHVLSWSLWPGLISIVMRQYLQSNGAPMFALWAMIGANVVNAVLNWALIRGHWGAPALGTAGSAWSTLIARGGMFVAIAIYLLRRDRRKIGGLATTSLAWCDERVRTILWLGAPAAGQLILEVGVFATATLLAGKIGAQPLAGHQIVLQVVSATFMVPLGLSSASAVLVARHLGAGDRERAGRTGWTAIALGGVFMAVSALVLATVSKPLLGIFTSDPEVLRIGQSLVFVAALFQISDGVQAVATGVLRGVGNTRSSMIANLAGHWVFGLPIGAVLCFWAGWGVHGLWIGLCVGLTLVSIALTWVWHRANQPGVNPR